MLALRIDFLNGTYHAADPSAPASPEWPPAPDRLYQALVAAAYGSGLDPSPLRELEGHPPEIVFGHAQAVQGATLYVPAAYKAKQGRVGKYDPMMVAIKDPVYFLWRDLPAELAPAIGQIAGQIDYLGRAKTPAAVSQTHGVPELPSTSCRMNAATSCSGSRMSDDSTSWTRPLRQGSAPR